MAKDRTVYSFELHFLTALKSVLSFEDAQTIIFGDTDIKEGPRIEIGMTVSSANPTDRGLINNGNIQYLSRYTGLITVQVFTQNDAATHFYLVGSCRAKMSFFREALTMAKLPLYQVKGLYEQGSQNGLGETRDDEIGTTLNFGLEWAIPRESFADDDPYITYNGLRLVYNGVPLTYNFEPIQNT